MNLTDRAIRKDEVAKLLRWGQLIKKCGGTVAVIGPNNVKRPDYVLADHKTHIVEALNDMCKALDDIGVVGVLHQHTGTCVETRDETYAVMEAVNARYVKFAIKPSRMMVVSEVQVLDGVKSEPYDLKIALPAK